MPRLQLLQVEGVGQRQQRLAVLDHAERLHRLAGHTLSRRVRSDQLRVVPLDGAQPAHQLVVLGVADLWGVLGEVQVVVIVDLGAQLLSRETRLLDPLNAAAHGSLRVLRVQRWGKGPVTRNERVTAP